MQKKQKPFNIVATSFMLRYFRQIDIFKVELGSALRHINVKQGQAPTIKIKDTFVKYYENINNILIHKYGSIGIITFYEDQTLPRYEFHVYKDDQVYEVEALKEDIELGAQQYLTNILKMINNDNDDKDKNRIKDIVYTNLPDEASIPDKSLPKEQYIEALLKRREILNKIK